MSDYKLTNDKLKDVKSFVKTFHRKNPLCLAFSVDGNYLASGGDENQVYISKTDTFDSLLSKKFITCTTQNGSIRTLTWHPLNKTLLATGSDQNLIEFFDISKFEENKNNTDNKSINIYKMDNTPSQIKWNNINGDKFCILDKNNNIIITDSLAKNIIIKKTFEKRIYNFIWSFDNKYILTSNKDGHVDILNSNNLDKIHSIQCHTGACHSLILDQFYKKYLITSGGDAIISLWNSHTLSQINGIILYKPPTSETNDEDTDSHMNNNNNNNNNNDRDRDRDRSIRDSHRERERERDRNIKDRDRDHKRDRDRDIHRERDRDRNSHRDRASHSKSIARLPINEHKKIKIEPEINNTINSPITNITLSYDSKIIAASSYDDNYISIVHTMTGKTIDIISLPKNVTITALIFHPKKYLLAYVDNEEKYGKPVGNITFWGKLKDFKKKISFQPK